MFEYIKLKNFKSLGNTTVDLTSKKDTPKKLILVYGENGIGKSNFVSAFYMLSQTLRTMDVRDILQEILSDKPDKITNKDFLHFFKTRFKDIETLITENKTVDSEGNMYLEFGFNINGKSGSYIIETDNTQIIHEKLEYTLLKNKGIYFEITPDKTFISEKIFSEKKTLVTFKHAIEKFWGKHSCLAILNHEIQDKSDNYLKEQLSSNLKEIFSFFCNLSCKIKFGSKQELGVIGLPKNIIKNYESGEIPLNEENILEHTETMLNAFFTQTFKDVTKVYYKKERTDNSIKYNLMFRKNIMNKERNIDFSLESTGTQYLLQLLPFILVVAHGSTAIIDEFDTGIHDILVQNLILSLNNNLKGQLILTTHNTLLMESKIDKECIYVINEDEEYNKQIKCITQFDSRIHTNTNIRNQYLQGTYLGIPEKTTIDFCKLLNML